MVYAETYKNSRLAINQDQWVYVSYIAETEAFKQPIFAVSSSVALRGDSGPCSICLLSVRIVRSNVELQMSQEANNHVMLLPEKAELPLTCIYDNQNRISKPYPNPNHTL